MSVSTQVNERLAALTEAGVSIWLDQIRCGLIDDGELKRMVREDSLRGVTSNPAIFSPSMYHVTLFPILSMITSCQANPGLPNPLMPV